jgi:hypothetical protein
MRQKQWSYYVGKSRNLSTGTILTMHLKHIWKMENEHATGQMENGSFFLIYRYGENIPRLVKLTGWAV